VSFSSAIYITAPDRVGVGLGAGVSVGSDSVGVKVIVAVGGIGLGVNVIVGVGVFEAKMVPKLIFCPVRKKIMKAAPRIINNAVPINSAILLQDWVCRFR
jgi:hypothetical protein